MEEFQRAWAVVVRDVSPIDGEEADVVTVLRVSWAEADALAEVHRLRGADRNEDRFYSYEATEVEGR